MSKVCKCGKVFETRDRRKEYHSRECGTKYRMRRMREMIPQSKRKESAEPNRGETLRELMGKYDVREKVNPLPQREKDPSETGEVLEMTRRVPIEDVT